MGLAYQRGIILYRQGRHAMACDEFRRELVESPSNADAHAMLALSLVMVEKHKEAHAEATSAIVAAPQRAFAHYAMASVVVRSKAKTAAERLRILKRAKRPAEEAIRLEPTNPDFISLLSAIELDCQRPAKALKIAERGLQSAPQHLRLVNLRAQALRALGHIEEAAQSLGQALSIDPNHQRTHANQGWNLLNSGNAAQAFDHFTEAMRLDPNDPAALRGLKVAAKARHPILGFPRRIWFRALGIFGRRQIWFAMVLLYLILRFSIDDKPEVTPMFIVALVGLLVIILCTRPIAVRLRRRVGRSRG